MFFVPNMPAPYPAPPGSSVNSIPGSMQSNNGGMPGMNNSNGGMPGMMNNMERQFPPTFSQPNSMVYLQNPMAGNNMGVTPGQGLPPAPTPNGASQTREALPSPVKQAPTPMGAAPMGAVPAGAGQVGVGSVDAAEKARRDTEKVAKDESCGRFYKQGWFICLIVFLVWMFTGIAFYMSFQQWPFFESMYYTLQAGLSIGFGAPFEDEICYRADIWESNSARFYVDGDHRYDDPIDNGRGGCTAGDLSKFFTTLLVLSGSSIAASAVGIIASAIFSRPGGWYKDLLEELYLQELRKKAAETETIMDDIPIIIRIWLRKPLVQAVLSLSFWIAIGVIYGMFSEQRMSFLTALYFAVTSVSTAGLEGLKGLGPDTDEGAEIPFNDIHGGHFFFVSIYVVIGIPLYAWALTSIASGYVSHVQKNEVTRSMYRPISEEEFKLMSLLGHMKNDEDEPGASDVVDMFEFVECQLLRLNKVSVTDLFEIKRRFMELDSDRSGEITKEELLVTGSNVTGVVHPQVERALEELVVMREKIINGERNESFVPNMSMGQQGGVTANPNQIMNPDRVRAV